MSSNQQVLVDGFATALAIPAEQVTDTLAYNSIPQWDSIAHMTLVAELESRFDVMMDTDDIIDMSSVAKAREILGKYGVTFD
ncbi:acyl carrier protein [Marinobacter oulmenensis]|uniref:Acyl carrier protein n=1 Tax=Marinobacter oulmenensis TaxID=643747 RepID=A0A840UEB4_9GAMM|nr:acyl carrier protein [Marinobacter oulmenensis]MBB5322543.1 acyl carrier protein [Marinobacter oulmenensis]